MMAGLPRWTVGNALLRHSIALLVALPLLAWGEGEIDLKNAVQKVEYYLNEDGERESRLIAAAEVVPGDELAYTITFENVSESVTVDAGSVVVTNPIPPEILYLEGTAFGSEHDHHLLDRRQRFRRTGFDRDHRLQRRYPYRQRVGVHAPFAGPSSLRSNRASAAACRSGAACAMAVALIRFRPVLRCVHPYAGGAGCACSGQAHAGIARSVWLRPWLASETDPARVLVLPGIRVRAMRWAREDKDLRKTRFEEQGPVMDGWPRESSGK